MVTVAPTDRLLHAGRGGRSGPTRLATLTVALVLTAAGALAGCSSEKPGTTAEAGTAAGTEGSAPSSPGATATPDGTDGTDPSGTTSREPSGTRHEPNVPSARPGSVGEGPDDSQSTDDPDQQTHLGERVVRRRGPLLPTPLPPAASATGRLVSGVPRFLRPAAGVRTESSSVSLATGPGAGQRVQVALVVSSPARTTRALAGLRARMVRWGLQEHPTPTSPAGTLAAAFVRGESTVTVTLEPVGTGSRYTLLAVLAPEPD